MNNKEAIRRIENILDPFPCAPPFSVETCEALEMAIDALKAQLSQEDATKGATTDLQPTCNQLATDTISRKAAIDEVNSETVSTNPEHFKSSEKFIKFMDDDDIASFGKWQWANGFNTALTATTIQLKKLPSAQPGPHEETNRSEIPNSSDTISRQAALNCFHDWIDKSGNVHTADEMPEYQAIEGLPSAQPERKTGHWILYDKRFPWSKDYKCSECGNYINLSDINAGRGSANFCPNCGADMRKRTR